MFGKGKGSKKRLSYLIIFCMLLTLVPAGVFAAEMPDISKHWAKDQIQSWVDEGLIKGYPDGTFKPDNNITRAEFMVLANGAFGYTETAGINYSDVKETDWFADTVKKAEAAGYIGGYPDGTMKPNNPISREEAATIISQIKGLTEDVAGVDRFSDKGLMSWSKGVVGAVSKAGIMSGYPDGSFKPRNSIKRGEAVVALDGALAYTEQGEPGDDTIVYDKAGTYGPEYEQETIKQDVVIATGGVILRNMIIEGDLTIAESVGNGEVYLKGVRVEGDTIINGGGLDSIYLENVALGNVTVDKADGKVRIVASGTTRVDQVALLSGAKLEEKDIKGQGFRTVEVGKELPKNAEVVLAGDFGDVYVDAANIELEISKGTIQNLEIGKDAKGTKVNLAKGSEIVKSIINAAVKIAGQGVTGEAEVNVDGSELHLIGYLKKLLVSTSQTKHHPLVVEDRVVRVRKVK